MNESDEVSLWPDEPPDGMATEMIRTDSAAGVSRRRLLPMRMLKLRHRARLNESDEVGLWPDEPPDGMATEMIRSIPAGWGCIAAAPPLLIGEAQGRSQVD